MSEKKTGFLQEDAVKEALLKAARELEHNNDILSTLCSDFLSIYRVNFDTGEYDIYKVSDRLRNDVASMAKDTRSYDETMERYTNRYVAEEEREYFKSSTCRPHVLNMLKEQKNYVLRYRVQDNSDRMEHFEIHFGDAGIRDGCRIVVVGFRNIDSIVRKEEAYRMETRHDLEETLSGSKTGLWSIEMEDGCPPRLYTDKTMGRLLAIRDNISPEDCYEHWFGRIDPGYVNNVLEAVDEIMRTGRSEVSYPWNHPTLGQTYVRCGGILDTKFSRPGFRLKGYHQDITETTVTRKRQEQALMEALTEAKRASQVKTEFLSHMSHDIRTPINGILGMLEIADRNPDDAARLKDCRAKIRSAAEHLLSLINDVLDISKLESGAFSLSSEPFDLLELLDRCTGILGPQAAGRDIAIHTDYSGLRQSRFIGSPLHLRQILLNIISNAIKYNKTGGQVFVSAESFLESDGLVSCRFIVRDTGIGMSSGFQERLFEPFTQENDNARTNYQGTGLGMAITKKLTEQMGGCITAQSSPGEGSTFTVTLPFQPGEPQDGDGEKKTDVLSGEADLKAVCGMNVLLVEDNEINREIAQYLLEDAGVIVTCAVDGRDALARFQASAPGFFDCVLMDVMMPVMNGLEAARAIRSLDRTDAALVPIIALSANAFAEDVIKSREAGMNAHLAKPLDANKMFHVMAQYKRDAD